MAQMMHMEPPMVREPILGLESMMALIEPDFVHRIYTVSKGLDVHFNQSLATLHPSRPVEHNCWGDQSITQASPCLQLTS